jgi:hypothetical protein
MKAHEVIVKWNRGDYVTKETMLAGYSGPVWGSPTCWWNELPVEVKNFLLTKFSNS